jgi:hypothetical protein
MLAICAALCAAEPALKWDPLKLPENAEVRFVSHPSLQSVTLEDLTKLDTSFADTTKGKFRLYVDLKRVMPIKDAFYTYDAYLQKIGDTGPLRRYQMQADPIGSFPDGWKEVGFNVIDGISVDTGVIKLPIHPFSASQALSPVENLKLLHDVSLGSESAIQIRLSNTLEDMGIALDSNAFVSTEQKGLWKSLKITPIGNSDSLRLTKRETEQLFELKLQPNSFEALTASLAPLRSDQRQGSEPLRSDQRQGSVIINVNYHVDNGGNNRRLDIEIPIRFVPSVWSLFALVCAGACLGVVFGLLLPVQNQLKFSGKTFGASIMFGLIVEIIAMVLVSNKSELIILGFELNPYQLLTSVLVGFFSGLTVAWRAEAIRTFFDKIADSIGSKGTA